MLIEGAVAQAQLVAAGYDAVSLKVHLSALQVFGQSAPSPGDLLTTLAQVVEEVNLTDDRFDQETADMHNELDEQEFET